jgi:hypothetical protein
MTTPTDAAARLALTSARVSGYCDHAEHLEDTDRTAIGRAGAELRALAIELAADDGVDLVDAYRHRLEAVEQRHPLYPAGGFAAVNEIPAQGATWRLLQQVQWEHDRHYHPDVLGLSRYEQLRHYAFHLAKLAGVAAEAASASDQVSPLPQHRLADLLLFGLKLATLINEPLPDQPVSS